MFGTPLIYSVAIVLLCYIIFNRIQQRHRGPLPPGPRGLPFLGNILDLPPSGTLEWVHWQKHKEQYGPITSVSVLGQRFVILHDKQAVLDMLETRALKSASRPKLVFASELVGYGDIMGMMPYNKNFRLHRKLTATQVSKKSIIRFEPIQERETLRFLKQTYEDSNSDTLQGHLNQTDPKKNDPIVDMSKQVMEDFSKATSPGAWMVDLIPWLKYVPTWMPGAGFKKTAEIFRQHLLQGIEVPYDYVKEQMANGNDDVSYVAGLIKDLHRKIDPEEKSVIGWTAASMLNAGTDTTGAMLYSIFAALVVYPEVQKRAQDEIDRVVGDSRLPSFSDKDSLPYVHAIAQEALRWHTLAPMGFPHLTTEDDTYNGYFIPKDTLLFPAAASLMHDPNTYHDPMKFKPERYFEPFNEPPPTDVVAVDEDGREIEVKYEQLPGVIARVKPFPYRIAVRSEKHRRFVI
ncbi:uncharacterized protein CLUP02_14188 [Colletotrichum lupini]|uniref:O-methylsterigmatocystin oxidoreductase n=1 Tax=Colletotrichum lupini TaxID=145971 RepID=A0A9Q8T3U5_9PEZI|nr:uncharacterized protein CLUP02_14188 [Colletotrichum lupini]UQC88663.1 hypothetical protein CLUP02_14188 [Colletotrichum lupini]